MYAQSMYVTTACPRVMTPHTCPEDRWTVYAQSMYVTTACPRVMTPHTSPEDRWTVYAQSMCVTTDGLPEGHDSSYLSRGQIVPVKSCPPRRGCEKSGTFSISGYDVRVYKTYPISRGR